MRATIIAILFTLGLGCSTDDVSTQPDAAPAADASADCAPALPRCVELDTGCATGTIPIDCPHAEDPSVCWCPSSTNPGWCKP